MIQVHSPNPIYRRSKIWQCRGAKFPGGSGAVFRAEGVPFSSLPITIVLWMRPVGISSADPSQSSFGIGDDGNYDGIALRHRYTNHDDVDCYAGNGSGQNGKASTGKHNWNGQLGMCFGSVAGENDTITTRLWNEDDQDTRSGTGTSPGGTWTYAWNHVGIGIQWDESDNDSLEGTIYEVALWNAVLDLDEYNALTQFADPRLIRPHALRGLWWPGESALVLPNHAPAVKGKYPAVLSTATGLDAGDRISLLRRVPDTAGVPLIGAAGGAPPVTGAPKGSLALLGVGK